MVRFQEQLPMTLPINTTAIREDVYRLLAACYYPPTAAFLEESCCDSLATLLAEMAPEAVGHATDAANLIKNNTLEELAVEHARLFMGPFQLVAPPYGSIYLDDSKTVMGDSTARVSAFYRANGLQLADDFHELPDHIAVELEFLSYLAHRQREAEKTGNSGEVERLNEVQQEFLTTYLVPWLEPFTRAIIDDGESPFYQAVARCTAAFINAHNG